MVGGKKKPSVELVEPDPFLKKLGRITVAPANAFLTTWNEFESKLPFSALTNASLEVFDIDTVFEKITSSYTKEVVPCTSLDESIKEFEFEMGRHLYLEMRDTHFGWKLQLFQLKFSDVSRREKAEHKAKSEYDSDEEPKPYLT